MKYYIHFKECLAELILIAIFFLRTNTPNHEVYDKIKHFLLLHIIRCYNKKWSIDQDEVFLWDCKRDKEPLSSLDDISNLIHLQKIDAPTFFPAVGWSNHSYGWESSEKNLLNFYNLIFYIKYSNIYTQNILRVR